ncbi:hypothetical protein CLAFUW4_09572 [Fulvia fulva]|uniref:Uncharacterized protein n=1 Tax=Passalora fulva TaxID=5499 RepID=A0A9Q8PFU8_PASFU|nr:uncharacterized protein CLAFUR5_09667 [Fulvia fulva]KAK4613765.1 hypothetical protein CLAFUR4_09578 [Fulvia fulva]KAK4614554.1 hypothetical protein CLAFUR0_09569 [Fulvia fulva]UJO21661.1 hypothetical protein CLAFUR5_09667 [Fulvia fulva]WPV20149.1 hypothetical protein CLAFUW4_09572 [Fulvia fulva]WPV34952.1 hypothetical protein CLAFUW7_09573 [Fulvia fulva]
MASPQSLSFSEKEAHLELAITCVQTLCNPLFWKRYYPWPIAEKSSPEDKGKVELPSTEDKSADNDVAQANEPEATSTTPTDVTGASTDSEQHESAASSNAETQDATSSATSVSVEEAQDDADDSADDEDRSPDIFKISTAVPDS